MSAPTPAAVALAVKARRAREAATAVADAITRPRTAAVRDEVQVVVRPASLDHWQAWLDRMHVRTRDVTLTGSDAVALGRHGDVPVRLVGHGVPALTFHSNRGESSRG